MLSILNLIALLFAWGLASYFIFKYYKLKSIMTQKVSAINSNYGTINNLSEDLDKYKSRAIDLEDAIEKQYGVKIRNEITEIVTDFTKLEMVVLFSGVIKLLEGNSNPDDAIIYANLSKKIQKFIDDMKEEEGV